MQIPQRASALRHPGPPAVQLLTPDLSQACSLQHIGSGMTPGALAVALGFFWGLWVPGPRSAPLRALGGVPALGDPRASGR